MSPALEQGESEGELTPALYMKKGESEGELTPAYMKQGETGPRQRPDPSSSS